MAKLDATQALGKRTPRNHPNADRVKAAMQEEEQKQLKVLLPASVHARFKAQAATEQRAMNDIMLELISGYLDKSEKG